MLVVTDPRIDPESLPTADGLDVRSYVHDLYRQLAACDLAIVRGGLTTAMELTANKRPFLYFPAASSFSSKTSMCVIASTATEPAAPWISMSRPLS